MASGSRIVVVTGASAGIGRATAVRLAEEGAAIVVADLQEDRAAETVVAVEAVSSDGTSTVPGAREMPAVRLEKVHKRFGEVVAVERAAIEFDGNEGSGTVRVGGHFEGEVQGQRAGTGNPTTLGATRKPVYPRLKTYEAARPA